MAENELFLVQMVEKFAQEVGTECEELSSEEIERMTYYFKYKLRIMYNHGHIKTESEQK